MVHMHLRVYVNITFSEIFLPFAGDLCSLTISEIVDQRKYFIHIDVLSVILYVQFVTMT